MIGETLEEPTFQFLVSEQSSSDLHFQFAFDESPRLVDLPADEIILADSSNGSRINQILKGLAMFLVIGFLTLSYSGLIKHEIQSNKAQNSIAQLSISNPINLLTSFYQPLGKEKEDTQEIQDLGLTIPNLDFTVESTEAQAIVDETINESVDILEDVELDEEIVVVVDQENVVSNPTTEAVAFSTPVVIKKEVKAKVNSYHDYSERDYRVTIENHDYKANKLQAAREDKYLLLTFSADWCMPCKVMEETVFKDNQIVSHLNEHFVEMKVDIDDFDGINLKQHFKVERVPTFIMLNKNDEIVGRYSRSMSTEKMLKILKNYR